MIELLSPEKYEVVIGDSTFILRELNREERTYFHGEYSQFIGKEVPDEENHRLAFELVSKCLVEWKGVIDSKTKENIPFNVDLVEWLPLIVIAQMANKILEKMKVRIEQEVESLKNLKTTLDVSR